STLKDANSKGRIPPPSSANGSLTERPLANLTASTSKEATNSAPAPAVVQAKSSTLSLDSGTQESPPSTSTGSNTRANLRGAEQSAILRSRLEGPQSSRNEEEPKANPRAAVREVVKDAAKLVRPAQRSERPEAPARTNRPTLTASKRIQVLGRALNAEVVDAEVARGPRELSIAKTAMRSRVAPRLRGSESISKLGASTTTSTQSNKPGTPLEGATVVTMPKPDRVVDNGSFKLRFNEPTTPQNTPLQDGAASREVVGESLRASLRAPVTDQKTSVQSADGMANKAPLEGDADARSSLSQDQNAGQRQGNQDRSGQKFTQSAPLSSATTDTNQSTATSFSEAVDSQLENTDPEDATLRLRQESSKANTSARHLERNMTGRTAQSSNQAQAQASMRQDMLHRLSAAEVPGHVSNLIFRNQEQARLQLHPAELGRMNLELQVKAGEVQLKVAVESAAAAAEIQSQLGQLKEQLQSQGLKLGDVSVDVSQKDFDSDAQSASSEDREQGENSGREREARQAEEQEQAVKKTKKREKSADGRLDVIA
ncbi:MAG: flagellar hook-length control protein FliK, partial [Myxococcota bacterium]|nr:flagellar hook-length control protein FliK [Myxococcota bacterium]